MSLPILNKIVSLKQNKIVFLIASGGEILLLWLIIILEVFSFSFESNEVDVLPYAKQFVDHGWLPNDWYLNLDIGYRQLFNYIFGNLISQAGFECGAYFGRLFVYLLIAFALFNFFRSLRLRFSFGILILILFLNHQSLIAGEWVVGGIETKTISYAFAILSLSFFLRKHYLLGFTLAGAAISFHVLVGAYALFCIVVATLLNKEWRSEWYRYFSHSWPLFISGFFGLQAIFKQLLQQVDMDAAKAWDIYVQFRNPHHLLPETWQGDLWLGKLVLATGLYLFVYFIGKSGAARFVAAYALGSVLLFLLGLVIFSWGEMHLLRYYWFRFPDVMVPLMSAVLIAFLLNEIVDGRFIVNAQPHGIQITIKKLSGYAGSIFLLSASILMILHTSQQQLQIEHQYLQQPEATPELSTFRWISENTPKEAIFLIDPTISDFYIHAQRALFVSFKHTPSSTADILEWYRRIKFCNGNRAPEKRGFDSLEELRRNFYNLDEDQIRHIAISYGISYYLGLSHQNLPFEEVYSNSVFKIYRISGTSKIEVNRKESSDL